MTEREPTAWKERVLLGVGCVVTFVWTVAVLVQVAFPSRPVPVGVHGIMFVIASGFFGGAAIQARRTEKNGGS